MWLILNYEIEGEEEAKGKKRERQGKEKLEQSFTYLSFIHF